MNSTTPGIIDQNAIYTLDAFKKVSALNDWAIREARRKGLRVVRVGRRKFVRGADFAKFLATQKED